MSASEQEVWPYTKKDGDKFPYFNFRGYLEARDLKHLLKHVKWGADQTRTNGKEKSTKRSKTAVNVMKLDIMMNSPELSAVVESNEAHIRLMSGTWIAIKSTAQLVQFGIWISATTASILLVAKLFEWFGVQVQTLLRIHILPYLMSLVLIAALWGAMNWAKRRIEDLFHYRRVGELLFIVQAAHLAREIAKKETKGKTQNATHGSS